MIFEKNDHIVFAGDSVTDMGSRNPVGESMFDDLGHGYVRMVDNILAALYPDKCIRVTNSGISGNTSAELLERFERDVIDLNPNWVSICIGINDVWRQFDRPGTGEGVSPEDYEKNIETMILSVKDRTKGIFLLTPYYMEPNKADTLRARMQEYVEICRKLADKHGCIFVDFQAMYDEYFKIRHSAFIAWDRVHPNEKGATLMAIEFLKKCGVDFAG